LPVLSIELLEPDLSREEESEMLLQQMTRGSQQNLFEQEIHRNPEDIEFESEDLETELERFRQQHVSEPSPGETPAVKKRRSSSKGSGKQGSLF
jgi:hypothetical protein